MCSTVGEEEFKFVRGSCGAKVGEDAGKGCGMVGDYGYSIVRDMLWISYGSEKRGIEEMVGRGSFLQWWHERGKRLVIDRCEWDECVRFTGEWEQFPVNAWVDSMTANESVLHYLLPMNLPYAWLQSSFLLFNHRYGIIWNISSHHLRFKISPTTTHGILSNNRSSSIPYLLYLNIPPSVPTAKLSRSCIPLKAQQHRQLPDHKIQHRILWAAKFISSQNRWN